MTSRRKATFGGGAPKKSRSNWTGSFGGKPRREKAWGRISKADKKQQDKPRRNNTRRKGIFEKMLARRQSSVSLRQYYERMDQVRDQLRNDVRDLARAKVAQVVSPGGLSRLRGMVDKLMKYLKVAD